MKKNMKKNKTKLTLAQRRLIYYLLKKNASIRVRMDETKTGGYKKEYNLLLPAERSVYFSLGGGAQVQNVYYCRDLGVWSLRTVKCLIRKKVLVCEIGNKEFKVQVALGLIDYKIYQLAEEYK